MNVQFTDTEQRLMNLLNDGNGHPASQLRAAIPDELAGKTALQAHLSRIRVKLRGERMDILYRNHVDAYYLVRIGRSHNDGTY